MFEKWTKRSLLAVVRRDESVPLLVAEPLHGPFWHSCRPRALVGSGDLTPLCWRGNLANPPAGCRRRTRVAAMRLVTYRADGGPTGRRADRRRRDRRRGGSAWSEQRQRAARRRAPRGAPGTRRRRRAGPWRACSRRSRTRTRSSASASTTARTPRRLGSTHPSSRPSSPSSATRSPRRTRPSRLPPASEKVDYEAEVAFVVGRRCKEVAAGPRPLDAIAGYMLLNDLSARDLQFATPQWMPGKVFDGSAPCGPRWSRPMRRAPRMRSPSPST